MNGGEHFRAWLQLEEDLDQQASDNPFGVRSSGMTRLFTNHQAKAVTFVVFLFIFIRKRQPRDGLGSRCLAGQQRRVPGLNPRLRRRRGGKSSCWPTNSEPLAS